MPEDVFEKIKSEIPWGIGVLVPDSSNIFGDKLKSVKNARRKDRTKSISEILLMMFRSAARDNN